MSWLIGQSIDRYQIVEQLGQGGMAVVFRAVDTRLERTVAIKLIRPDIQTEPSFLSRFEREAKAVAQLSHPNIVTVLDYGDFQGTPFLVMEYIPGGTLKDRLGKSIPWNDAVRMLAPIAHAMEYAHTHHIIHRDLKPANLLIGESGELLVTDFGIAKIIENSMGKELTGTGVGIGTPEYMAPEQGLGNPVDGRADVYSLGIVLYEMVTGRRPFQADTPMAVILKHISDPLPPPRQYLPDLPDDVEKVICKALAKNPQERHSSMAVFASALERVSQSAPTESTKRRERPAFLPQTVSSPQSSLPPAPRQQPANPPAPRKGSSKAWKFLIPVGLVIILCAGIAALTAVGYFGQSLLSQTAKSTPAALEQQKVSPVAEETAIQTPQKTQNTALSSQLDACTGIPALPGKGDWPAALCETFDDNSHQWSGTAIQGQAAKDGMDIVKGEMVLDIASKDKILYYQTAPGQMKDGHDNSFSDLFASTQAQEMGGDSDAFYGVIFNADNDPKPGHWLFFGVNKQRQTYALWYFDGKEIKELLGEVQFPTIQREGMNQISVVSEDNTFSFYINNEKAADHRFFPDDFPPEHLRGKVGLAVMVHPSQTLTTIVFDNFMVKAPNP